MPVFFGTAQSYANKQALLTRWKMKKEGQPMLQTKGNLTIDVNQTTRDMSKQAKLKAITAKLKGGMRLTPSELAYVKETNPELYQKIQELENERAAYKKKLENCKTKDEVSAIQAEELGKLANEAQTISNNPNIPLSKKIELMDGIQMRVGALQDEHTTFVKSENYQRLKWEYELDRDEKAKARKRASTERKEELDDVYQNEVESSDKIATPPEEAPAVLPPEQQQPDEAPLAPSDAQTQAVASQMSSKAPINYTNTYTTKIMAKPIADAFAPDIQASGGKKVGGYVARA